MLVPIGTRPEIIKLAPIVDLLSQRRFDVRTVATGQHHDPRLSDVFFDEFGRQPDERWAPTGDESERVGTILTRAYRELDDHRPDLVLLLGDTHTVPLFSLAARRHHVPVAHLEAGLRSFNPTSMEEVNRKVAAAATSLHFAPTELSARFLRSEGVSPDAIRVVGNPVLDVLRRMGAKPEPITARSGVVITAHRPTNVDDPDRLEQLIVLACRLAAEVETVTFPVHPRTWARLQDAGAITRLRDAGVRLVPPVPYREMLTLIAGARVVLTDSGGLQEEAAWLGVPVVVLRRSTPRWEGVMAGTSQLVGLDVDLALSAVARFSDRDEQVRVRATPCPYGDGHTAARVAAVLEDPKTEDILRLEEPQLTAGAPALAFDRP